MQYKLRAVEEYELEECAKVIREGFSTVAKDFGLTIENSPTNGAFIQKERLAEERSKGQRMYGLIVEEQMVGFMQLEKNTDQRYFLQKLVIHPDYRHHGFGKILLDYAKEKVSEVGGNCISIGIIEENTVLKNWYLDYGFQTTGTKKFDHLPFTVGFMELKL